MQFTPTLHKLSNGLPVILDPMDIETACMSISIGAGSRNESPAECGISHFLEHMLCAGTKTAGRDSFTKMLNQAKDRGGSINASTSDSRTRFYGRILSENFEFLCDILPDMVLNSTLLPENIERERGVIHQELKRALDNSERQFGILVDEKLFAGTGLEHMVLGKAETISSISRENLMDYYGRHYSSGNTIIGISGKFDADRVLAALEKVVGKISARDIPAVVPTKLSPTIHYETREDKNQTKVLIGFED
ncbi:MAG: insulinase family protein, partial [Proteobacteria bacterium]|nr:insulinase family protein [Pseudomonadota bacterium]